MGSGPVTEIVRVYTPQLRPCECVCFFEQHVCVRACTPQPMLMTRTRLMGTKNSSWELQQHNPDLEENKLLDLSL